MSGNSSQRTHRQRTHANSVCQGHHSIVLKWVSWGVSEHRKGVERFEGLRGRQRSSTTQSPTWAGHLYHIPAGVMVSVSRSGSSGLLVKCSVPTGFQLPEELDRSRPPVLSKQCVCGGLLGKKGLCPAQLRVQLWKARSTDSDHQPGAH